MPTYTDGVFVLSSQVTQCPFPESIVSYRRRSYCYFVIGQLSPKALGVPVALPRRLYRVRLLSINVVMVLTLSRRPWRLPLQAHGTVSAKVVRWVLGPFSSTELLGIFCLFLCLPRVFVFMTKKDTGQVQILQPPPRKKGVLWLRKTVKLENLYGEFDQN